MAEKSARVKTIDVIQSVVALAAIPLGLIPLVQWIFSKEHSGVFRFVFGEQTGAMGILLPILTIIVAIAIIGILELAKKRSAN